MLFGLLVFSWPLGVSVKFIVVEDQPILRSRRLKNLPPSVTMDPPPPPQRKRLDTDGFFELVGVSEVSGELELRHTQVELTPVEIENIEADEFTRKFNTPLIDLSDPVLV